MDELKKELMACEYELLKAMRNCDIEKMDELLHDDLLFSGPAGETITKEIDLETYRSGNMVVLGNTASDQEISIFGDTAIVLVNIDLKAQFMQELVEGRFRYIRVWKNSSNVWKVIGGGVSAI